MDTIIKQIEQYAHLNMGMLEGLDYPEQMLYISLRGLYASYDLKIINQAVARKEKAEILESYKKYRFWCDIFKESAQMRNKLSYHVIDISKNGCPYCKKAVEIFTDRDKA